MRCIKSCLMSVMQWSIYLPRVRPHLLGANISLCPYIYLQRDRFCAKLLQFRSLQTSWFLVLFMISIRSHEFVNSEVVNSFLALNVSLPWGFIVISSFIVCVSSTLVSYLFYPLFVSSKQQWSCGNVDYRCASDRVKWIKAWWAYKIVWCLPDLVGDFWPISQAETRKGLLRCKLLNNKLEK